MTLSAKGMVAIAMWAHHPQKRQHFLCQTQGSGEVDFWLFLSGHIEVSSSKELGKLMASQPKDNLSRSRLTCWAWHHATQNTLRFGSDWIDDPPLHHPLSQGIGSLGVYVSHPWKWTWNTIVKAGWFSFSNAFFFQVPGKKSTGKTPSPQGGWTTTPFHLLGRTIRTFIRRAARRRVRRCPHRPRPARWHLARLSFFL